MALKGESENPIIAKCLASIEFYTAEAKQNLFVERRGTKNLRLPINILLGLNCNRKGNKA